MTLHSGIVTTTVSALLLNVFFNVLGFGGKDSGTAESADTAEGVDRPER